MHSDPASETGARPQNSRLPLLMILAVTALSYAASLSFGFVYDDVPQVVTNPRLTSWRFVPSYFTHHVWIHISESGTYYRPLFLLWLRLNEALFGTQNPLPWHLTTLLLHLVAVALVFRLMRRSLPDLITAAIATVIFALHPGHVESVGWISGCTEPLMTCAFVGSILCWMNRKRSHRSLWMALSWVLFVAALLVKETAIILPGLIAVYGYVQEPGKFISRARRAILAALPFAVLGFAELLVRGYVLRGGVSDETHTWPEVLTTVPHAAAFYLKHLFWPVGLSPFYDVFLASHASAAAVLGCIAIAVVLVLALIFIARTSDRLLVAFAWLVLPLIPAFIGLRLFDTTDIVHDRYLYLSTIGLGMLVAMAATKLRSGEARIFQIPAAQFGMVVLLIVAMVAGTAGELRPWANNLMLFIRGVLTAPNSSPAYSHLAFEMYKRGDVNAAQRFYKQAVVLDPNDWHANFGLAVLDMRVQQWGDADEYFQRAIDIKPLTTNASYLMQCQVRMQMGQSSAAEQSVRTAIEHWPDVAGQHLLLAQILLAEGRKLDAQSEFRQELKIDPASVSAKQGLLQTVTDQGS